MFLAPGETETQHLWRQGRPPAGPTLTLALVQKGICLFWVGSCSFMESFPSGHNAWEKVSNVLFVWDIWFYKKLKKQKNKRPEAWSQLCLCVPGKAGPGLQVCILLSRGHCRRHWPRLAGSDQTSLEEHPRVGEVVRERQHSQLGLHISKVRGCLAQGWDMGKVYT